MEPTVVEDTDYVDLEAEEEEDAVLGSSGDSKTSVGPAIMQPNVAVDFEELDEPEADEYVEILVDCNTELLYR